MLLDRVIEHLEVLVVVLVGRWVVIASNLRPLLLQKGVQHGTREYPLEPKAILVKEDLGAAKPMAVKQLFHAWALSPLSRRQNKRTPMLCEVAPNL